MTSPTDQPREIFDRDESGELLDLIRASRDAYGSYVSKLSWRLDEATVDQAFKASQEAASAVEQWVINRTDFRPDR